MPKRTDMSARVSGAVVALGVLLLFSVDAVAQHIGSQFCAYLLNEKGQTEYLKGNVYLEPPASAMPKVSLVQFSAGVLRADHVPAGDYELVLDAQDQPVKQVRVHFEPSDPDGCNPQLLVHDHGTFLETEWRDSRTGWVDPGTDFLYTLNRLCGRLGMRKADAHGSEQFRHIRAAVLKLYERVPDKPCCGKTIREQTTRRSGAFDFGTLPEGPYWLTASIGQQTYKMPVRIVSARIYQNEGCLWFYLGSGDKLQMQTTVTVE